MKSSAARPQTSTPELDLDPHTPKFCSPEKFPGYATQRVMTTQKATTKSRNATGKTTRATNVLLASFPSSAKSPVLLVYKRHAHHHAT